MNGIATRRHTATDPDKGFNWRSHTTNQTHIGIDTSSPPCHDSDIGMNTRSPTTAQSSSTRRVMRLLDEVLLFVYSSCCVARQGVVKRRW